jgi:hypothetical protein
MQKSPCCAVVCAIFCERRIDVTSVIAVGYGSLARIAVAVSSPILHGVMHDISKTGLVHAKFRGLDTKRVTKIAFLQNQQADDLPVRARSIPKAHG